MLPPGSRNAKNARNETNHSQHNKLLWKHLLAIILLRCYPGTSWAFSKWVEAFAIQSTETEALATLLVNEIICRYGIPTYLYQGTNFNTSKLMAAVCKTLGIEQTRTSSYHPQGNGQVEHFNRTLETMLARVVSDHQRDWTFLACCLLTEQFSMKQLALTHFISLLGALLPFH